MIDIAALEAALERADPMEVEEVGQSLRYVVGLDLIMALPALLAELKALRKVLEAAGYYLSNLADDGVASTAGIKQALAAHAKNEQGTGP
jgi:hypothetical protein